MIINPPDIEAANYRRNALDIHEQRFGMSLKVFILVLTFSLIILGTSIYFLIIGCKRTFYPCKVECKFYSDPEYIEGDKLFVYKIRTCKDFYSGNIVWSGEEIIRKLSEYLNDNL